MDQDVTERPVTEAQGPPATAPAPGPPSRRASRRRGRPSKARGHPNSSDDATARWTIRGVPPPVRDMALRAAEARGMTVGDWVAEAIVGLARSAERVRAPVETSSNLPTTEQHSDIGPLLQRLDERLTRIEQRQSRGFFGRLFGRRN